MNRVTIGVLTEGGAETHNLQQVSGTQWLLRGSGYVREEANFP